MALEWLDRVVRTETFWSAIASFVTVSIFAASVWRDKSIREKERRPYIVVSMADENTDSSGRGGVFFQNSGTTAARDVRVINDTVFCNWDGGTLLGTNWRIPVLLPGEKAFRPFGGGKAGHFNWLMGKVNRKQTLKLVYTDATGRAPYSDESIFELERPGGNHGDHTYGATRNIRFDTTTYDEVGQSSKEAQETAVAEMRQAVASYLEKVYRVKSGDPRRMPRFGPGDLDWRLIFDERQQRVLASHHYPDGHIWIGAKGWDHISSSLIAAMRIIEYESQHETPRQLNTTTHRLTIDWNRYQAVHRAAGGDPWQLFPDKHLLPQFPSTGGALPPSSETVDSPR